jgi:hypothetical protein
LTKTVSFADPPEDTEIWDINPTPTLAGMFEGVTVMVPENPLRLVTVYSELLEEPRATVSELGMRTNAKSAGGLTITVTRALWVILWDLATTVIV